LHDFILVPLSLGRVPRSETASVGSGIVKVSDCAGGLERETPSIHHPSVAN